MRSDLFCLAFVRNEPKIAGASITGASSASTTECRLVAFSP
jgi:hypothetical protein